MSISNILIADTQVDFCKSFLKCVESTGVAVSYANSVDSTLDMFITGIYSLLIMDICIPNFADGLELIRIIRQMKQIPILVFSENLSAKEKVSIFHAGATVCMDKPVDIEMCTAQAFALIMFYELGYSNLQLHEILAFGTDLVIYVQYRQVVANGAPLDLTRTEFDILHLFACRPRQVFSTSQIHDHLWGNEIAVKDDGAIRAHIKRLRHKLSAVGRDCIQNVRGVGYRLIPPNTKC